MVWAGRYRGATKWDGREIVFDPHFEGVVNLSLPYSEQGLEGSGPNYESSKVSKDDSSRFFSYLYASLFGGKVNGNSSVPFLDSLGQRRSFSPDIRHGDGRFTEIKVKRHTQGALRFALEQITNYANWVNDEFLETMKKRSTKQSNFDKGFDLAAFQFGLSTRKAKRNEKPYSEVAPVELLRDLTHNSRYGLILPMNLVFALSSISINYNANHSSSMCARDEPYVYVKQNLLHSLRGDLEGDKGFRSWVIGEKDARKRKGLNELKFGDEEFNLFCLDLLDRRVIEVPDRALCACGDYRGNVNSFPIYHWRLKEGVRGEFYERFFGERVGEVFGRAGLRNFDLERRILAGEEDPQVEGYLDTGGYRRFLDAQEDLKIKEKLKAEEARDVEEGTVFG